MTQLTFDDMAPRRVVRTAPGREEPAVWVRALRIVRELSDAPHDLVREVRLRRGLNVVWAPPQGTGADMPNEETAAIAGHTAGKTSFVRLLRYVLGDRHFGSEAVRRRVRERLPLAYVLAEVVVAGESWGVARPLGVGLHPFCVRGATLDGIVSAGRRDDLRDYLDAIAAAVLRALPATRFPEGEVQIGWEHLLPWLTRDQECRFADFVEWRHPTSASEAPALTADQRHFLVRAVLDLVTDAEREEQERNARLVAERKAHVERRPLFEHQGRTDEARLRRLLGVELTSGGGLFAEEAAAQVERLRTGVAERRARLTSVAKERDDATLERDRARDVEADARRDVQEAELLLSVQQGALTALDAGAAGEKVKALLADLKPGRAYCSVRLVDARAHGCPLVSARTVSLDERRAVHLAPEDRARQAAVVAGHVAEVETRRAALRAAEDAGRLANDRYLRAQTAHEEARDALRVEEERLRDAERLVAFAADSWRQAEAATEEARRLSAEVDASYARQEMLREARAPALGELSAVFEHVVQALLGPGVQARVAAAGRSLALHVERDGERESAALATVKLLAFDLAAMTASVEGRGAFPRLLVHDGPREADLAADIYERLFRYACDLEAASDGEPAFQYVLTTTTEPPEELRGEPWVRLLLSGAAGDARLYRMDL